MELIAADRDLDMLGREVCDVVHSAIGSSGYRTLFETANVGLVAHNPEILELVDINQHYLDILGIGCQSVVDMSSLYITADTAGYDAERALHEVEVAHEEDGAVFMQPIEGTSGGTAWIRVSLTTAEISGRDRLILTVEDVIEERQRERDLVALREVIDTADAEVAIMEHDRRVHVN